jgi:rare lipoprotein A
LHRRPTIHKIIDVKLTQRHFTGFAPALAGGLLLSLLSACGSLPGKGQTLSDGAPQRINVNLDEIADAVPKHEPLARYGNPASYEVFGITYQPLSSSQGYSARGIASWYGTKFHGRLTSTREPYDMYKMTAAHKTLPIPSYVQVTNLENGKQVVVRVNDRGPFHEDRIIDLSYVAAHKLDVLKHGTARVEIKVITPPAEPLPAVETIYLQVGAFGSKENAEQMRQQLLDAKISSGIKIASASTESPVYKVHLGPLENRESAQQLRVQLQQLGLNETHVVSE